MAEFIAAMQRVHGPLNASLSAYELLWSNARRNLAERAERASAMAGRTVAPHEMLAPSRFALRFAPTRFSARIEGDWAVVTLAGDLQEQQHEARCVRERGEWRVVVELPPLPAIEKRFESTL